MVMLMPVVTPISHMGPSPHAPRAAVGAIVTR
jgi:hypothetical protein